MPIVKKDINICTYICTYYTYVYTRNIRNMYVDIYDYKFLSTTFTYLLFN